MQPKGIELLPAVTYPWSERGTCDSALEVCAAGTDSLKAEETCTHVVHK